jgi:hypothetical protein
MAAAAHNPAFAKKLGIPQNVARDFNQADFKQANFNQANQANKGKPMAGYCKGGLVKGVPHVSKGV